MCSLYGTTTEVSVVSLNLIHSHLLDRIQRCHENPEMKEIMNQKVEKMGIQVYVRFESMEDRVSEPNLPRKKNVNLYLHLSGSWSGE